MVVGKSRQTKQQFKEEEVKEVKEEAKKLCFFQSTVVYLW